jgi:hypothetical protein
MIRPRGVSGVALVAIVGLGGGSTLAAPSKKASDPKEAIARGDAWAMAGL